MAAPKGNKNALGNRGGYRKGYEWEADQMKMMSKHINWMFAYVEAVRKGRNTVGMDIAFQKLEKILLKEMDKLHANKQMTDLTTGGEKIIPIFNGQSLPEHNSDKKDISAPQENPGSGGGDIGQQDNLNSDMADRLRAKLQE